LGQHVPKARSARPQAGQHGATKGTPAHSKHAKPVLNFGSRTDIGCVRKDNEDSLLAAPPLFVVADGMGGHAAGEIASEIAVGTLSDFGLAYADPEALQQAVLEANREVIRASREGRGRAGMGTTLTAALVEGERLVIAQVGDSRAYLLHGDGLQQITRDHSLMADMIEAGQLTAEEARFHPNRSVITRALGSDPHLSVDLYEINVETGDRLLLCSDGLSGMVTDDEIRLILGRSVEPQKCANMLVNQAIAAGGHDNVTVIVVDITGFSPLREKKSARKAKATAILILAAFLIIVGGALGALYLFAQNSVYLANDNGKVAIYHGVPGSLFGLSISRWEETTDIEVSTLQPGLASRLDEGIRVDDMEAARALIDEYRKTAATGTTPAKEGAKTSDATGKGADEGTDGTGADGDEAKLKTSGTADGSGASGDTSGSGTSTTAGEPTDKGTADGGSITL
jgi:protein phosphatase